LLTLPSQQGIPLGQKKDGGAEFEAGYGFVRFLDSDEDDEGGHFFAGWVVSIGYALRGQ
jgi:hypothetical protein